MFINPAFSVRIEELRTLHPTLTTHQIQDTLDLVMQTEAFQATLLDTFDLIAARIPDRLPDAPPTPDHQNRLRLALILYEIRRLDAHAIKCGGHIGIPIPLWQTFITQAKPDQPPHYSSTPE